MSVARNTEYASTSFGQAEECIKAIEIWMVKNRLKLNGDKTEMLINGINKQCKKLTDFSMDVGGSAIKQTEKARNPRVFFIQI